MFIHDPAKRGRASAGWRPSCDESKLRRVLARMLDEDEFLGPHGIRSVSRYHLDHPYVFSADGHGVSSRVPSR